MSSREEKQRRCAHCGHPKSHHELSRAEGGHGGGDSGRCVVYACGCPAFELSDDYVEQSYSGDEMPAWVKEGARVKVKRTEITRHFGLRTSGGSGGDLRAWPGEVAVIERVDGAGWWDWHLRFDRGRHTSLNAEILKDLIRVRG